MRLKIRLPIFFFLLWTCLLVPALHTPAARMKPGDEGDPGGLAGHDSAERALRSEETDSRARPPSRPEGWAGKHSLAPGSGWIDRNSGPRPKMEQPERPRAGTAAPATLPASEPTESPAAFSVEEPDSGQLPDSVSEPDRNPEFFPEDSEPEAEPAAGVDDLRGLTEGEPEAADETWSAEQSGPTENGRAVDPEGRPQKAGPFPSTTSPPE